MQFTFLRCFPPASQRASRPPVAKGGKAQRKVLRWTPAAQAMLFSKEMWYSALSNTDPQNHFFHKHIGIQQQRHDS